jgi:nucleoside 2-deoxyribosyltransferase
MTGKVSNKSEVEEKIRLKCGLIMPIAALDGCTESHWEEVRNIIKEALFDTEFDVELVSDSNEIGIIQNRIVTNIYKSDMVICDVSGKNPNVMFELGMRLAFDKPTLIIKDDKTNYSFDTAPIEHISYPRDLHYHSVLIFKETLKTKLLATHKASLSPNYTTFLKHFGEFRVSEVSERTVNSETYILEVLEGLTASVKGLQNSLYKSPEYVLNPYSNDVQGTSFSLPKSFQYINDMVDYHWNVYKKEYMHTDESLRDNVIRRDAIVVITNRLEGVLPISKSSIRKVVESNLDNILSGL